MGRRAAVRCWLVSASAILALGCASVLGIDDFQDATSSGTAGRGGATTSATGGGGTTGDGGCGGGAASVCGNGVLDCDEECDDANDVDADGCTDCVVDCDVGASEIKDPATGHCYRLVTSERVTWSAARTRCQDWGQAELVGISSDTEFDLLFNAFVPSYWTGGTDQNDEDNWRWINGEPWHDSWATGQPNNANDNEHCATFDETMGALNDRDCMSSIAYLCERPLPPP